MKLSKPLSYSNKKVFIGIDVHRHRYSVTCICEGDQVKSFSQKADDFILVETLRKTFPGAELFSAYEAGFSGFCLHRYLESSGVKNIVVNPSSIEISSNDRVKTDKRDSLKIATQLSVGRLKSILIPSIERERKRLLTRTRAQLVRERTRLKNMIRFRLHQFNLISIDRKTAMNLKYVKEILELDLAPELKQVLVSYKILLEALEEQISSLDAKLRTQAKEDELEALYRSAPGIGPIAARVLSNELGDMSQFRNEKALFSYTGLTPQEYSSGQHRRLGHISRQGNSHIRGILIECSWVAIKYDSRLREDFKQLSMRVGKKRAIVAIARKLIGRIRAAIRSNSPYKLNYKEAA